MTLEILLAWIELAGLIDKINARPAPEHRVIVGEREVDIVLDLDPQDRGDEVCKLAQAGRLSSAQARQGQQDKARGYGQLTTGTVRGLGHGQIEIQLRQRRPRNAGNYRTGNGRRLLDVGEPALQQVRHLGGGLEAVSRVLGE